jgi:sugar/nucleoside kinase (ribokinase family)
MSILVVGDAAADVLAGPLDAMPRWGHNTVSPQAITVQPGGSALNVAVNLSQLQVPSTLYSATGSFRIIKLLPIRAVYNVLFNGAFSLWF